MAFPARYDFKCSKCNKLGKRGERISWSRKHKGIVYHAECAPVTPDTIETEIDPKDASIDVEQAYKENQTSLQLDKKENVDYITKEHKTMENKDLVALDGFAELLAPKVQARLKSNIDEQAIKTLIKEELVKVSKPKTIELKNPSGDVTKIESPHKEIAKLLYYISKRHHVYLHGPAGSGKSTAAKQVAEALNLSFGYLSLNPQTPDSRILGFLDAGGSYRSTIFYKCYKDGGVFCIDEMDNASAALLTTLNSMLENGLGAFPCGLVPRHKDFVLVATGNTNGKGGNPMFPERRPFDMAFSERFTFLFWGYDVDMERKITFQINPKAEAWFAWVLKTREYTKKTFPRVLVSPRVSFKGAEYLKDNDLKVEEIAEGLVFKGLDEDTVKKILAACPLTSVEVGG